MMVGHASSHASSVLLSLLLLASPAVHGFNSRALRFSPKRSFLMSSRSTTALGSSSLSPDVERAKAYLMGGPRPGSSQPDNKKPTTKKTKANTEKKKKKKKKKKSSASASASSSPTVIASLRKLMGASGDDVRGIASPDAEVPLMPESAFWIGAAFREWLSGDDSSSEATKIAVGRDPRLSSFDTSTAFCRGASASDAGPATTPAMLECLLPNPTEFIGAVMVTASHLPMQYNGLKLFSKAQGRGLNKKEVKEVMATAVDLAERHAGDEQQLQPKDDVETLDGFMLPYVQKLKETIIDTAGAGPTPLDGMKICVNAGNGAGGFFSTDVLAALGADTSASIHLEADGNFPNHPANPEDKAHVAATMAAVEGAADVGVMLDTDVDRCGLIDGCRS